MNETRIEVLDTAVYWADGYENSPSLTFLLSRMPEWDVFEKRPCAMETLSSEQVMVVGGTNRQAASGWHIYHSEDDDFAWFFTWGGKPDAGFGGSRRVVTLTDGFTEEVVGGWHVSSSVAEKAGFAPCVDVGVRTSVIRGQLAGGTACFITHDRFKSEATRLLPDVEVVEDQYASLTVKWRGQPTKREFMASERERRIVVRESLENAYGRDWYKRSSNEEHTLLACRPYSALGPAATS